MPGSCGLQLSEVICLPETLLFSPCHLPLALPAIVIRMLFLMTGMCLWGTRVSQELDITMFHFATIDLLTSGRSVELLTVFYQWVLALLCSIKYKWIVILFFNKELLSSSFLFVFDSKLHCKTNYTSQKLQNRKWKYTSSCTYTHIFHFFTMSYFNMPLC